MRSMYKTSVTYLLGGASLLSTFIVTVLDGVCYALSKSSPPNISTIESAVVGLASINCVVLVALLLFWMKDIRTDARVRRKSWRVGIYVSGIAYLSIATGVTAGGIAWSEIQFMTRTRESSVDQNKQLVLIARCVLWAISVLCQGILGGYLLTTLTKSEQDNQWPRLISYELDVLPDQLRNGTKETPKAPSLIIELQRESMNPKTNCDPQPLSQPSSSRSASQGSNRYSGKTLFHQDSKSNSLDLNPTLITYQESVTTHSKPDEPQHDRDSDTVVPDNHSGTFKIQQSDSEVKRSLDGVVLQPSSVLSSPSSSTTQLVVVKRPPPKLKLPDESNIHPLFRSDSRSPPPTPTPGTIVLASPAAGQTISVKTLNRVRSTRSVGPHTPRSRSPLFERMDQSSDSVERAPEPSLEDHIIDQMYTEESLTVSCTLTPSRH